MTEEELAALLHEAIDYLDYVGWGDRWERECYADTRKKLKAWKAEHPKEEA